MATPQLTHLIVFCGPLAMWLVAGEPLPAADKFPVPSAAAQNEALKLIESIYADEHAKAQRPEEKTAFAEKLLQATTETSRGTPNHYALLRVSWDVATQGGDVKLSMRISNQISHLYDVDAFTARMATVKKTAESAKSPSHNTALAAVALEVVNEAVAGDDYDAATELATIALAAARKARDGHLVKQIVARGKVVTEMAEAHARVQTALSTLADDPTDPHANQAAGAYYCFVKGDWGKGIPMLALGSDVALRTLAVQDLKGTSSAKEQAELGDQWWQRSESSQDPQLADRLRSRAASWYRASVGRLAGLDKIRVQKRLQQLGPASVPRPDASPPKPAGNAETVGDMKELRTRSFARIQLLSAGTFVPLIPGAKLAHDRPYSWTRIPPELRGLAFLKNKSAQQAVARFRVVKSGLVLMAVSTRWGGAGAAKEWGKEFVTRAQLEEAGWREFVEMEGVGGTPMWLVFARPCKAGESFAYRTEKYLAPILLLK